MRMTTIVLFVCPLLLAFDVPSDVPAYTKPTFEPGI